MLTAFEKQKRELRRRLNPHHKLQKPKKSVEKWKDPETAPYDDEVIVLTQANQIMTAVRFDKQKQLVGGTFIRDLPTYWTIQIFAKDHDLIESVTIETPKKWKRKI